MAFLRGRGALSISRDVYSGYLKHYGEEHEETVREGNNYSALLQQIQRYEEAKSLLRKLMPVARRVLGEGDDQAIRIGWSYGEALYHADGATLDELREAVTTLEDTARAARRVLGGANPLVAKIERALRESRAALHARETPHA